MIYLQQRQLAFTLKVCPNGRINLIQHNRTLSLNLSLTVQFLKNLSAFVIPKQLTPRGRLRGSGGCPIGSSFPRHGARIRTKTQSRIKQENRKKNLGQTASQHKKIQKKKIYMHEQLNVMMHALSIEFLTKTPKILKNHLFNLKKI